MKTINTLNEYLVYDVDQLHQHHKPKEAKKLVEALLESEPTNSYAHYYLGCIYQRYLLQYQLAESHFRLAIKFNPPCPDAFIQLGIIMLQKGELHQAELILHQGLNFEGINHSVANETLGNIYEMKGRYLLARKHYKLAVRSSIDNSFVNTQMQNLKRCRIKLFTF
jgi:Tfp pilus assembly protein PilF